MSGKIQNTPNRLALDVQGTADLREKLKKDPQAGLQSAAQQFEAMFLQMVMKSMRDATPQDGMFDSDQSRFYTSMLDQQLAQNMASGKGVGFARLIEQQLGHSLPGAQPAPEGGAASPETDPAAALQAANRAGNSLPLAMPNARHMQLLPSATVGRAAPPPTPNAVAASAPAPAAAAAETTAATGASTSSAPKDFVNKVWPHAVEASRATGIPPQFLVGQAALESNWGRSEPRRADGSTSFNLFGIKAGKSWNGAVAEAQTTEYIDGQAQRVTGRFRAYGSYAEAFRDYANLLRNNSRYGNVVGSQDGTEFAKRLQQAGYATDPAYADKLSRIINGPTLRQALIG